MTTFNIRKKLKKKHTVNDFFVLEVETNILIKEMLSFLYTNWGS